MTRFTNNIAALRHDGATQPQARHISATVDTLVARNRPSRPLYVIEPARVARAVERFTAAFPGKAMFAVKANPDPEVIRTVYQSGMDIFDVASIEEVRLVRALVPQARVCFFHPVKSPEAIHEAYHVHGVRSFVVDYAEEVHKIMRGTNHAPDLMLFVRLVLPRNDRAAIDFSSKFGASPDEAIALLRMCRSLAERVGMCFHVGTQAEEPEAFERGIDAAAAVIDASGVAIDCLNIGGGYPVAYADYQPHSIEDYMATVRGALERNGLQTVALMAEPGRCLVADAVSLVVRVEQRRGDRLYLNDGTYGGLFDAGPILNTRYPVRALRPDADRDGTQAFANADLKPYHFAGPTCDALDMMVGPFLLPADITDGDWIEVGQVGAYSQSLRTNFNGFGHSDVVYIQSPQAGGGISPAPARIVHRPGGNLSHG